ncbi:MAG TPA: carboxypeptidase regulatory-like domain-containing protein [Candidatus Koribacter sp.]|jgi:hypothetical protein
MHRSGSLWIRCFVVSLFIVTLTCGMALAQSTGGRIVGKITDPSGAVIPGATITVSNDATGVTTNTVSDKAGEYSFPSVPVGTYSVRYVATGFKETLVHNVTIILNQVSTLNQALELGQKQEVVDVSSEAPIVDTTSTQLGAVVDEHQVVTLPLNTRDTYQLLQLQPGVMSNVGGSNTIAYGSDQPGVVSVNGGRGRSNNFNVNGGDANDLFANIPTVQPNPDSIEEFRVLTNTFDAEYGRNSGAVVNVVTKSGTNNFHGSMYEFFRNKVLNSKGYFDPYVPDFEQNQFGGTIGGPIKKDRTFFFVSYEGRRIKQGIPSSAAYFPDASQRNGDFSGSGAFTGTLNDQAVADALNGRPGCDGGISTLGGAMPAAGTAWSDIFPTNQIPTSCMDSTAVALMKQYVPLPNAGNVVQSAQNALTNYQSVPNNIVRGDQGTVRLDHRISNTQNFNFYYYVDDSNTLQALSFFQQAGANVPGFGSGEPTRVQQFNLSHTWTLSNTIVNEARFTYMREGQLGFQHPSSTNLVSDSCGSYVPAANCFSDPTNPLYGITPHLGAGAEGVPFITVPGSFSIGNNFEGQLPQVGNSFQWSDSLSKVWGNHTTKYGIDVRRMRFDQTLYYNVNGEFSYDPTSGNSLDLLTPDQQGYNLVPDYLLGLPYSYSQGSAQRENVRSTALYLFAQDSWKMRSNVTLNYGLRWELNTPLSDALHHVQTFRPGQVTTQYPCQLTSADVSALGATGSDCSQSSANNGYFPLGLVFPGDKNVPAGLTSTYFHAFAPRIGIAWSPNTSGGFLHKLFGNSGDSSIRAGYGIFYNPIEQLVLEQFGAEPPFGGSNYIYDPGFNTPFLDQSGTQWPNPFNGILSPTPGTPIDWSSFRPILLYGDLQPHLKTQYSEQYNLTIQREIGKNTVLQLGYVGSQGHHLLDSHDINYANPQTCLDLNAYASVTGGCGQGYGDSSFFIPPGTVLTQGLHLPYNPDGALNLPPGYVVGAAGITLVGLRQYSSPNCHPLTGVGCPADGIPVFSSIFAEDTIGNSNYNSFQAMLQRRFAKGLQFQAAYTWSKSFDLGSTFEGEVNPIDPRLSYSLSAFDARHRVVLNYDWEIPVRKMNGFAGKILNGWTTSGIVTLQSGFPIRITSGDDNELFTSYFFEAAGEPNQMMPFSTESPQKNGGYYFNPSIFSNDPASINYLTGQQLFGTVGNARRTICCGPGVANWDMTMMKETKLNERWNMEFRAEFYNILNHTQFYNPDGSISDSTFGQVQNARDPRLVQFAVKFAF